MSSNLSVSTAHSPSVSNSTLAPPEKLLSSIAEGKVSVQTTSTRSSDGLSIIDESSFDDGASLIELNGLHYEEDDNESVNDEDIGRDTAGMSLSKFLKIEKLKGDKQARDMRTAFGLLSQTVSQEETERHRRGRQGGRGRGRGKGGSNRSTSKWSKQRKGKKKKITKRAVRKKMKNVLKGLEVLPETTEPNNGSGDEKEDVVDYHEPPSEKRLSGREVNVYYIIDLQLPATPIK